MRDDVLRRGAGVQSPARPAAFEGRGFDPASGGTSALPKCPLCLAAWLTVATGVSVPATGVAWLRWSIVLLWAAAVAPILWQRALGIPASSSEPDTEFTRNLKPTVAMEPRICQKPPWRHTQPVVMPLLVPSYGCRTDEVSTPS